MIAEYLRLRQHKLRVAAPYCDETTALRTVTRTRGDLVGTQVATANQLTALLEAHWPGASVIFADIDSPIALAFLTRYPTPAAAASLGEKRMTAFCVKHGYSGRRTAAELLARLRGAPPGTLDQAPTEALRDAVLALVTVLQALNAALKTIGRSVTGHLGERPDGEIFTSLPRSGQINAAQMLAETARCPTAGCRCAGPARRRAASTRYTRRSAGSGKSPNLASPRNHASPRCREMAVATRSGSPNSAARWPDSARPWPGCAAPCDRRPHPATAAAAAGHRGGHRDWV